MRYLPITEKERNEMMETIGIDTIDDLFPNFVADSSLINLPKHKGEAEIASYLHDVADQNINDRLTLKIREFNKFIKDDNRVESLILPIGDGLSVCRKK